MREIERERLLQGYEEGVSNIDWKTLVKRDWNAIFEGISSDDAPRITKAEWLEGELAKWDERRIHVPSHRVQDPEARVVKYRQKFVEFAKTVQPETFEELRILLPDFVSLFTRKSDKDCIVILNDLKLELIGHRVTYGIESFDFKWDYDYVWGELSTTLYCANFMLYLGIPQFDDILGADIKATIGQNQYSLGAFTDVINRKFEATADEVEGIPRKFFNLQLGIYRWVEKHRLQKDWLVDYAYYFLNQFSENPGLSAMEIIVASRNYHSRTVYFPFKFETTGWWAGEYGENVDQFEDRVTKEFEIAREKYILEASSALSLNKLTKFTKPPSFENVEWLVYRVLKGWTAERIVEKFFPCIAADRTKSPPDAKFFKNKKTHIENEMRELKKYGLPHQTQSTD